jgi:ketosteroid isomerase-like protein
MIGKRLVPAFLAACMALSCGNGNVDVPVGTAIRAEMASQVQAWNSGDIPGFMEAYADSVCFISLNERTCGKSLVTSRYIKKYPDKAAMGRLDFGALEVLSAGADYAWCTGTWRLVRPADTLSGGFSLFWVRTPSGWKILRDHTY